MKAGSPSGTCTRGSLWGRGWQLPQSLRRGWRAESLTLPLRTWINSSLPGKQLTVVPPWNSADSSIFIFLRQCIRDADGSKQGEKTTSLIFVCDIDTRGLHCWKVRAHQNLTLWPSNFRIHVQRGHLRLELQLCTLYESIPGQSHALGEMQGLKPRMLLRWVIPLPCLHKVPMELGVRKLNLPPQAKIITATVACSADLSIPNVVLLTGLCKISHTCCRQEMHKQPHTATVQQMLTISAWNHIQGLNPALSNRMSSLTISACLETARVLL